jgi:hypothetical protein
VKWLQGSLVSVRSNPWAKAQVTSSARKTGGRKVTIRDRFVAVL